MVEYDYAYLRGFIKEQFRSNQNFADFIGIGITALYDRLSGKTAFRQDEIDAIVRGYGLSGDEIKRIFFTRKVRKTVQKNRKEYENGKNGIDFERSIRNHGHRISTASLLGGRASGLSRVQDWAKDDHSNAAAAGVYGKDGGRP